MDSSEGPIYAVYREVGRSEVDLRAGNYARRELVTWVLSQDALMRELRNRESHWTYGLALVENTVAGMATQPSFRGGWWRYVAVPWTISDEPWAGISD